MGKTACSFWDLCQSSIFNRMYKYGILLGLMVLGYPLTGQRSPEKMIERRVKGKVPSVSVTELAVNPSYIRLDAREKEEFEVSHMPNAYYIGYKEFDARKVLTLFPDKDTTLVVYCSVGIRSDAIGKKLMALGYTRVRNLSGGIFKWLNEGFPLIDSTGKETNKIHAYNRFWGLLLQKGEKVYGPENHKGS